MNCTENFRKLHSNVETLKLYMLFSLQTSQLMLQIKHNGPNVNTDDGTHTVNT